MRCGHIRSADVLFQLFVFPGSDFPPPLFFSSYSLLFDARLKPSLLKATNPYVGPVVHSLQTMMASAFQENDLQGRTDDVPPLDLLFQAPAAYRAPTPQAP